MTGHFQINCLKFQKRILRIEREIPPNPVIKRIT